MPQTLNKFLDEIEKKGCPECCGPEELFIASKIIREMNNTLLYFRDVGEEDLGLKKKESF